MFESKLLLFVGLETALLLLLLTVFLLARLRGLRQLVNALEERIIGLRGTLKGVRIDAGSARKELAGLHQQQKDYGEYVDDQLAATRNHHLALDADRDIVLDIAPGTPPQRQALALRHAFLIAEKEAWLAADGKDIDWAVLESKLAQIIQFYEQGPAGTAAADTGPVAAAEAVDAAAPVAARVRTPDGGIEIDADKPSVGRLVIANQEEMQRLRNMAVDQHRMIVQLRLQLSNAQSVEEKDAAIAELKKQLEWHERFLRESDICSKQLESELQRVLDQNHALEQRLARQQEPATHADEQELARLQKMVSDFTRQSCDMLSAIETLEKENGRLLEELRGAPGDEGGVAVELKAQLAKTQQELLNAQTRYLELEERYLELQAGAV